MGKALRRIAKILRVIMSIARRLSTLESVLDQMRETTFRMNEDLRAERLGCTVALREEAADLEPYSPGLMNSSDLMSEREALVDAVLFLDKRPEEDDPSSHLPSVENAVRNYDAGEELETIVSQVRSRDLDEGELMSALITLLDKLKDSENPELPETPPQGEEDSD